VGAYAGASQDISFQQMTVLVQRAAEIVQADPGVAAVGSSVGGSAWSGTVNNGRLFHRPQAARRARRHVDVSHRRPYAARSRRYTGPARLHVARRSSCPTWAAVPANRNTNSP